MSYQIIADSCCDVTPQLKERLGLTTIPLLLCLGDEEYTDDENLDLSDFMRRMKQCKDKIGSASPNSDVYRKAFVNAGDSFAITISSELSGSFMSANIAKGLAADEGATAHVFDSRSASAGELLLAIKLRKLIDRGLPKADIVDKMEHEILDMRTFFMLENLNNLVKNGRMNIIQEKICSALNIRPLFCAEQGKIAFHSTSRGDKELISKFAKYIAESEKDTCGENLVITHCENLPFAQKLQNMLEEKFHFSEILITSTRGLSSLYASEKGVIIAF